MKLILKVKVYTIHYTYGMFAAAFTGAVSALHGLVGLAVGAGVSMMVDKPNWQSLLSIFGTTFVLKCFEYVNAHPIPPQLNLEELEDVFDGEPTKVTTTTEVTKP